MTDDRFAPEEDSFPQGSKKLSLPCLEGGAEERGGGIQNLKFHYKNNIPLSRLRRDIPL